MPSVLGCLVLPTCGVIPLFHRRFRVSYLIQIPKAIRLNVNRCRALSSPPAPPSACGVRRAYKTPARPRWNLCFCVSGILSPNVCRVRISHLSAVDVSDGSNAAEPVKPDGAVFPLSIRQRPHFCSAGMTLRANRVVSHRAETASLSPSRSQTSTMRRDIVPKIAAGVSH